MSGQGHYDGEKLPGLESLRENVEKSQQCHKYSLIQYRFTSEKHLLRTWGRQNYFLLWAPF